MGAGGGWGHWNLLGGEISWDDDFARAWQLRGGVGGGQEDST